MKTQVVGHLSKKTSLDQVRRTFLRTFWQEKEVVGSLIFMIKLPIKCLEKFDLHSNKRPVALRVKAISMEGRFQNNHFDKNRSVHI